MGTIELFPLDNLGRSLRSPQEYACRYCPNKIFATDGELRNHFNSIHTDPRTGLATDSGAQDMAKVTLGARSLEDNDHAFGEIPRCRSPESSSGESMNNHKDNITPPESPHKANSPGAVAVDQIGRLSLDSDRSPGRTSQSYKKREILNASTNSSNKRSAPFQLTRPVNRQAPALPTPRRDRTPAVRTTKLPSSQPRGRLPSWRQTAVRAHPAEQGNHVGHKSDQHPPGRNQAFPPRLPRDSGYETGLSRANTLQQPVGSHASTSGAAPAPSLSKVREDPAHGLIKERQGLNPTQPKSRYPGLILQPDSSPISQEQLAAEVKGIYAGLVMVEAKCINIDATQANDPNSKLGPEQWQALIALHRTLLYEHHDFLMATQHPSATPALRGLATKYSMPARMWKHGIHAFLEVLRHRRPESQDYMLAFIYLAYQMMALLFETVPSFTDTWIECLGDLARYRMAIEEEKEAHATWGAVAGRWYTMAADRHPSIGRLNHHLGILERPSLRKFFLYAKSLTCVLPFPNARDSLTTLCGPIVQDELVVQTGAHSIEASIVKFHAQVFMGFDTAKLTDTASSALSRLSTQPASKIRDIGVEFVVTNLAFILELGLPTNNVWQLFGKMVNDSIQNSRPSASASGSTGALGNQCQSMSFISTSASTLVIQFCYASFETLIRCSGNDHSLRDFLPGVHVIMVWLHAIHTLQRRISGEDNIDTFSLLLDSLFPWSGLVNLLNMAVQAEPITARTIEYARLGTFLTPERNDALGPLPEDYSIRGLMWTQLYFPPDWFNRPDEDGRIVDSPSMHKARIERVQWLGVYLALHTGHMRFNTTTRTFCMPEMTEVRLSAKTELFKVFSNRSEQSTADQQSPASRSPTTFSTHSDSDGYAVVAASKTKPTTRTWANVVSRTGKNRPDYDNVKIFDDEVMHIED